MLLGSKVVLVRLPSCGSKPVCYHTSVVLLYLITAIYPVESAIQSLNNRGLINSTYELVACTRNGGMEILPHFCLADGN